MRPGAGRLGRLALPLACVLVASALLAPAGALGQADAGPLPGGVGNTDQGDKAKGAKAGADTLGKEVVPYELKGPKGVSLLKPSSLLQSIPHVLAQIIWAFALYLLYLALLIFSWAFEIDLVNGPGGALGPVGQTVNGIYSSLGGGFLVAAVLVAGLWALYRGVAQRRYAQTVGSLGLSVLCVAGALWAITDPQASVGQVASWSQAASAELLSLTEEAAPTAGSDGPGAPLPGSPGAGTQGAADTIFNVGIVEPAEILNGKELIDVENGLQRLGLAALAAIGTVGIALFVGFFSLAIVLLQAIALLIFAFAPVALIAAVVPGRGHDVFATWAKRLLGALVSKALLSLMFGVVLAIGAAVLVAARAGGGGADGMGWFTGFFLYAAFFWAVLIFYSRIFGGLPLRAAAAPVSGTWRQSKARYREFRAERRQERREERQEATYQQHSAQGRRERGLDRTRQERDRLEREVTPAHLRDERTLAEQEELRDERARLDEKASPTPEERERLDEVRAAVVSDEAYDGLRGRVAEHRTATNGGDPAASGQPAVGGVVASSRGRHEPHDRRGIKGSMSPTQADLAEHRERFERERADRAKRVHIPTGVGIGDQRPRIDVVEDALARVYGPRGERPVAAAPWRSGGRDVGDSERGSER